MTKVMETLKEIVEFFSSYDTWAKITMLSGIVIFFGTLIIAPHKTKHSVSEDTNISDIFEKENFNIEDLRYIISKNSDIITTHFKDEKYDKIHAIPKFKLYNEEIDLLIYFHNDEMNQIGRHIILVDFYEIEAKNVDWAKIDADWRGKINSITWQEIKSTLEKTNGFNYSLERSNPMGQERPGLRYFQLCGRRKILNQVDLTTMQNTIEKNEQNNIWRAVMTYDFFIDKFKPFF